MKDVIVIGGGPSGATAAHLLAEGGADVLVLEREIFPRFHIGESLLPCDLEIFERLGLELSGERAHLYKSGAEFFDERTGEHAVYPFADSLTGTGSHAFQVDRAEFDHALLRGAASRGAEVREGERVVGVDLDTADEVVVSTEQGAYHGRYLIDATGQDSFLARRHRSRRRIEDFGLAAVYRHFHRLKPAMVRELESEGNIKIFFIDDGWLWAIPLGHGRLSVGLVTRRKGIADGWLDDAIQTSPELSRVLDGATPMGEPRRIGSFSFHNEMPHGPRWVCVGDAACFLDPIFSSGVSLGMLGAAHAADVLLPALAASREAEPGLMDGHSAHMTEGYDVLATLISSVYRRRLLPGLFFTLEQDPELRQGLTSVLAGDVWRGDNRFQDRLMGSQRRRYTFPRYASDRG